ncbi:MAG: lactate racemase domain-containing protein [Gemmataceae bacterium]
MAVALPRLFRVRQTFGGPKIDDIPAAVAAAMGRLELGGKIKPGQSVALTAGSRGIANIPTILKATVDVLRGLGAKPFLVPAMGSHGGSTAEGQKKVLESYGITEDAVGAPIRSSMEIVEIGRTPEGWPVWLDKIASAADHIGVVARVKPHTSYGGSIESGWLKMMMIGLGKQAGAAWYHRVLLDHPYDPVVRSVSRIMREKSPILFGLAAVENGYEQTALIEAAVPSQFEPVEERLLVKAKEWLARMPFAKADLLVIDEIGKEISGSGMDTNVVGRKRALKTDSLVNQPDMRHIFIRGLSAHTHGNAAGIGFADFTTARLVKAMNHRDTVLNCVTSGYPQGANIPVYYEEDRQVIENALRILGLREPQDARIQRIRNTLHLEYLEVSEPCLKELEPQTKFEVLGPVEWNYDAQGNLPALQMH